MSQDLVSFSNGQQEYEENNKPPPQRIQATLSNLSDTVYVGVVYSQNGLETVTADISSNPFTVDLTPKAPAEVGIGTVEDQVVIAVCEDPKCDKHIQGSPAIVKVSYTVGGRFHLMPEYASLTYVVGSSVPPFSHHTLSSLSPLGWVATAQPSWLQLEAARGQTPDNLDVGLDLEQVSKMELGYYSGEITVSTLGTLVKKLVVPVTLQVAPPSFSSTPSSLTFEGVQGEELPPRTLSLALNTEGSTYGWTATIDTGSGPRWLSLSSTEGTVSTTPQTLTVSVDPTGLPNGGYSGQITFTSSVQGIPVTQTIPVSLSLLPHKLWVSDNGVGLVSTPSASRLTYTVKVKDNAGETPAPWTASSNQPWLSVTASGGDTLTVTADPSHLATDTLYLATVTLSPQDSSLEGDTLQVGLWVGSRAPNSRDTITASSPYWRLAMDPIRPYAYVHDGTNLDVYNIYTASRVARIPGLGHDLSAMTLSTDGSTLYVVENTHVIPVDLATLTPGAPLLYEWAFIDNLVYARPGGHDVIVTSLGDFYTSSGRSLSVQGKDRDWRFELYNLAVSVDGSELCANGSRMVCYDLRYTNLQDGSVVLTGGYPIEQDYGIDVAITQDRSHVYAARLEHPGVGAPWLEAILAGNLAVDLDNRLYVVGHQQQYGQDPLNLWVFDDQGHNLVTYRLAPRGQFAQGLEVSGDGKRFATIINQQTSEYTLQNLELFSTP